VLSQIAFEATAREEPRIVAIGGDEHQRARLAVRRAGRVYEDTDREGIARGALTFEQRKERT
jgi:hypothetical protein